MIWETGDLVVKNQQMAGQFRGGLVAALTVLATSACGSVDENAASGPESVGRDVAALFSEIQRDRASETASKFFVPDSLEQSLPNQRFEYSNGVLVTGRPNMAWTFSEAILVGKVVKVELLKSLPGHVDDQEDLDSMHEPQPPKSLPSVNWALVSVKVEQAVGEKVGDIVQFQYGLDGVADPKGIAASFENLGRILVVVDPDETGLYYPSLEGALIGDVESDGSVAFPGLGETESAFVGGLNTVDRILNAARTPTREAIVLGAD